jgi:hypothetical protein
MVASTSRRSKPFLSDPAIKGTPAEYKAGLDLALARGWIWLHESGSYVKITKDEDQGYLSGAEER